MGSACSTTRRPVAEFSGFPRKRRAASVVLIGTSLGAVACERHEEANDPDPVHDLADRRSLLRLSDWRSLPVLEDRFDRFTQQTSRDRKPGQPDFFPLARAGNRDYNNFVCASADAESGAVQISPFNFDLPACPEEYVRGFVMGRFEGAGRMVRIWIGMVSLLSGPADAEVLRIYVDDDSNPKVEVSLRDAMSGNAGEIFAPPFGAGSPRRLAWYYPVAFRSKFVATLDRLGDSDGYFYHVDVKLDDSPPVDDGPRPPRLVERDKAVEILNAVEAPAGPVAPLGSPESVALEPGATHELRRFGPATIHEVRVRVLEDRLLALGDVRLTVRWDGSVTAAMNLPLLDVFASSRAPPTHSSLSLASGVRDGVREFVLRLPMPFESSAEWAFTNDAAERVAFDVDFLGEDRLPAGRFGHLHVRESQALAPTQMLERVGAEARGRGRLVGMCVRIEGRSDPRADFQADPLNALEGDVRIHVDGELAMDGTGSEEYADDVFYFTDAPHANAFAQAWGIVSDEQRSPPGQASFCRWHVLGTEIDFGSSLTATFELGAGSPEIVDRHHTVAYFYLAD